MNKSPVYNIKAVPVEKIVANDYNPNTVASPEMKLLYDSIKEDGYTMPSYVTMTKTRISTLLLMVFIVTAL